MSHRQYFLIITKGKKMKKIFTLAAVIAGVFVAGAMEFKVECEKFTVDANSKSQGMGSASEGALLFFAKGGATATAKIDIPETQRYYVWVRDYSMNGKTRRGTLSINNRKVGTFGDAVTPTGKGGVWMWNKAPFPVKLEAGEATFKIVGNPNCRFDTIYFTDDPNAKPDGKMGDTPEVEPYN